MIVQGKAAFECRAGVRLKILEGMLEDDYPMMFAQSVDDIDRAGDVYERLCSREEELDVAIVKIKETIIKHIKDEAEQATEEQELDMLVSKAIEDDEKKPKKKAKKKSRTKSRLSGRTTKMSTTRRASPSRPSISVSRKSKSNLLPMTPIDSSHKIRFDYTCQGLLKTEETPGCPTQHFYRNGDRKLVYRDGTEIIIINSNGVTLTHYPNGDKQQEFKDGATAYIYAANGTIDFRHPDGTRVLQFKNGRRDKMDSDGKVVTTYHTTALHDRTGM